MKINKLLVCLGFLAMPLLLCANKVANVFERSYWIDIDLRHNNGRGYWKNYTQLNEDQIPTSTEIQNACKILSKELNGNKLYVTYHRQFELSKAKSVLSLWKKHGAKYGLTIVPTIVLEDYSDKPKMNFNDNELLDLGKWSMKNINANEFGIYDVYIRQAEGSKQDIQMKTLRNTIGDKLVRVGLQPGEQLNKHMVAGVEDTWTAECQGLTNQLWEFPKEVNGNKKFGRLLLEDWVMERISGEEKRIVWNKIPVAWDYDKPVDPLGYVCPGDDALINDPPIKGRLDLCDQYISNMYKKHNVPYKFYGYSCDLHILEANSYGKPEEPSFYETLRKGETYKGYFSNAMKEVSAIYQRYKK